MPFAAMTKKELPQTITLFNPFRNIETGKISYYRTILESVRVDKSKTSLRESLKGETRLYRPIIWLDKRTTKGRQLTYETKINKAYMPWSDWKEEPEKDLYWTLYQQHLFALPDNGQKETIAPDFVPDEDNWQDFVERYTLRPIVEIAPTIDDDGSIHHWIISLN